MNYELFSLFVISLQKREPCWAAFFLYVIPLPWGEREYGERLPAVYLQKLKQMPKLGVSWCTPRRKLPFVSGSEAVKSASEQI